MSERLLKLLQKEATRNLQDKWLKLWSCRMNDDFKTQNEYIEAKNHAKAVGLSFYDVHKTIIDSTKIEDRQEALNFLAITMSVHVTAIEDTQNYLRSLLSLTYEYHLNDPLKSICTEKVVQIYKN